MLVTFDAILSLIAKILMDEHTWLGTWDAVGKEYNRPKGTLCRIANEPGYCPRWLRENIKRAAHTSKDLYAMSTIALHRALEERKEVQ